MNDKILHYIWLSNTIRPGSPVAKQLFNAFGTIDAIFNATKEDYADIGISPSDIASLCSKDTSLSEAHYRYCIQEKIGFLCYEDPLYPERLKITNSPPALLYYRGRLANIDDLPCFAMVGTRSCSERGYRLAYETAFEAASKGAVIVNGLAKGIDAACIAAALDANGYAIGVLGCGIDRIYPYENKELFHRLSASGLIITEFAPFTEPAGTNFPIRNRVMSGISLATVVYEAEAGVSGAMRTAEHALSQGRRIFAVPGKPYDKSYSGPLELIKNGATVFTEADDIISEFSMSFPHRLNISVKNKAPKDKLDEYVAAYFKKGTDPDTPVNKRFTGKQSKEKNFNSKPDSEKPQQKSVSKAASPAYSEAKEKASTAANEHSKSVTDDSLKIKSTKSESDLALLSVNERKIYDCFAQKGSEMTVGDVVDMGFKIEEVLSTVTLLEIYGLIEAVPGGRYKAV